MTDDAFDEIERMVGELSQRFGTELAGVPADVIERDDEFLVRADLPGFDAEDVEVRLADDRTLEVSATREAPEEVEGRYVTRERRHGSVSRTVSLPDTVEAEGTEADYDAGVLTVTLQKRSPAETSGTDIPVN